MKKRILMAATMAVLFSGFSLSADATAIDPDAQAYYQQLIDAQLGEGAWYQIMSDVGAKRSICQETGGDCQYYDDLWFLLNPNSAKEVK